MTNCEISFFTAITTYINYAVLIFFGYLRDAFNKYCWPTEETIRFLPKEGYAPLLRDFEEFYARRIQRRAGDCWGRAIASAPDAYVDVMRRTTPDHNRTFVYTGETIRALNLSSYNYLGFSVAPEYVQNKVAEAYDTYGSCTASCTAEFGYSVIQRQLEVAIAQHVGKEDAFVVAMGFATNSTVIPALCQPGTLIISDSLNHTSIITGARASGAKTKVFHHGDYNDLERCVRSAFAEGQPITREPWKKIIILVEGIYSMEGEIVNLPRVVEIKKKYKCYLYVDEAHSIGALGSTGGGVVQHWGVNPADIDILMGTFTKSFGSVGGYIAASKHVIDYLRKSSYGILYGASMSAACAQQALSVLDVLHGRDETHDGRDKIKQLHENANFFREGLRKLGFEVIGDEDSPVIIAMIYNPAKLPLFSRKCLERGLAIVVVGAPATELIESRVRFCISAAHSRQDLERALVQLDDIGDLTMTKYSRSLPSKILNIVC